MVKNHILNLTQREVDSYEWRKNSESKDPGYCGSTSFEHHIEQVRDPKSWVNGSMLTAWEMEYNKDNTPKVDRTAELEAQLDAVRCLPRFNLEKAKGKDKYRVVQDDWGEFVFYNDLLKALEQK